MHGRCRVRDLHIRDNEPAARKFDENTAALEASRARARADATVCRLTMSRGRSGGSTSARPEPPWYTADYVRPCTGHHRVVRRGRSAAAARAWRLAMAKSESLQHLERPTGRVLHGHQIVSKGEHAAQIP